MPRRQDALNGLRAQLLARNPLSYKELAPARRPCPHRSAASGPQSQTFAHLRDAGASESSGGGSKEEPALPTDVVGVIGRGSAGGSATSVVPQ